MVNGTKMCVVVANKSFAEIYSIELGRELIKLQHIDHPAGRLKDGEVLSDRPGRSFSSFGAERHAYSSETDLSAHEQHVFAQQVAQLINKEYQKQPYERLVLIAPPQFLGELRQTLPIALKKTIYKEFSKDLPSFQSDREKVDHICRLLEIKKPASLRF